jgi:PadR family transcriptional regulator, regulatory protein PadR
MSPSTPYLGEFEQLMLLAILRLGADASGVGIGRELEDRAGRRVARGALYTTLDRLEDKGLLRWKIAPGGDDRARLPRRLYSVTARGLAAVRAAHGVLRRMSHGIEDLLESERS